LYPHQDAGYHSSTCQSTEALTQGMNDLSLQAYGGHQVSASSPGPEAHPQGAMVTTVPVHVRASDGSPRPFTSSSRPLRLSTLLLACWSNRIASPSLLIRLIRIVRLSESWSWLGKRMCSNGAVKRTLARPSTPTRQRRNGWIGVGLH
jgi:hypothetical protein